MPPPPALPVLGTSVFVSGLGGYHTYRIPAAVGAGAQLLVFAEGRKLSSADHGWNDIVLKRSNDGGASVRARPARLSARSISHRKLFSMAVLYGCAGRLTAKSGGFRPGQWGQLQLVHGESTAAKHVVIGNPTPVAVGIRLGCIVAWCYRLSTLYQIHQHI